jgi:hypothetical protein
LHEAPRLVASLLSLAFANRGRRTRLLHRSQRWLELAYSMNFSLNRVEAKKWRRSRQRRPTLNELSSIHLSSEYKASEQSPKPSAGPPTAPSR